jgi:hypothetical protein
MPNDASLAKDIALLDQLRPKLPRQFQDEKMMLVAQGTFVRSWSNC